MFWKKPPPEKPPRKEPDIHHSYWEMSSFLAKIMFDKRFRQPEQWSIEMMSGGNKTVFISWEDLPNFRLERVLSTEECKKCALTCLYAYMDLTEQERLMMLFSALHFYEDSEGGVACLLDPRPSLELYDYGKNKKLSPFGLLGSDPLWKAAMDFKDHLWPSVASLRLAFLIYQTYENEPPYDLVSKNLQPKVYDWAENTARMLDAGPFRPYRQPERMPKQLSDVVTRLLSLNRDDTFSSSDEALSALQKALKAG